ncbi:MAG TPA: ABC transporter substrate-binding protein [Novosphingobium sp.]|nr:ABC transporter substrate-binding protein [Novosphingobium sp.]
MAAPILVGIYCDLADAAPSPSNLEPWLRREVDLLIAAGRIDRPVEFRKAWGLGLPSATAAVVERAIRDLAAQEVLMIVGPAIGDNAMIATPLADELRVPMINWSGAARARSEWMFHLQVGSHEDEGGLIARHFADLGCRRIGVAHDRSTMGRRYLEFFRAEAELLGLDEVATVQLFPEAQEAGAQADALLAARPDAILYLGLGLSTPALAHALAERGWTGPRAMNTSGLRGYDPEFAGLIDGWAYVDMHSDDNRTLATYLEATGRTGERVLYREAAGYDMGRLVAEGIARAPDLTRAGIREGLEHITWLPAAEGREGTTMGFGVQDRGALKGRYMVMRQWIDGKSRPTGRAGEEGARKVK